MKNIVFDPEKVNELVINGSNLVLKPEAEEALLALFSMKDRIEEAIDKVKSELIKKGRGVIPSFKGVEGDRVRAYIKKTDKYTYDKKGKKPLEVMKKIEFYKLDEALIEKFLADKGTLPMGVQEKENCETLVFKVKDETTQSKKIEG